MGEIKGVGENPHLARVMVLWAGRLRRLLLAFYTAPGGCLAVGSHWTLVQQGVDTGSPRSLGLLEARDNRFSVSGIPRWIQQRS